MNAAELASYDQIKTFLVKTFPTVNPDSKLLHFGCGLSAGFIAVVCASPVDVIKTRVMNVNIILIQNPGVYNGAFDCLMKTLRIEGPLAFYNGFYANFWRVGIWNIIMFVTLEQCQIYVRDNVVKKH